MQRIAQVRNAISYGPVSKMNDCDIIGTQSRRQAGALNACASPAPGRKTKLKPDIYLTAIAALSFRIVCDSVLKRGKI